MKCRFAVRMLLVAGSMLLLRGVADAQTQIVGDVKDESGAVLPGVTVEAASPVLIEKAKTAVTDDQGRYALVNLRPGTYKVTFTLTGFATVVKDGVELPADFVATVNAQLKVGSLEETITVSGQAATVDTHSAARTTVLSRDLLDSLPSARTLQTIGSAIPGIRVGAGGPPDVGGTRMTLRTEMVSQGMAARNNASQIDGMPINSSESNGANVGYLNDALTAEVSVTNHGMPAEVSGGGIRINTIPKDGGNHVSGSAFIGGSNGTWQSDNLDPSKLKNVTAPAGIKSLQNFSASLGGPIMKDKVWFFFSPRHLATNLDVVNGLTKDGRQLIEDQYVRNLTGRLTYQVSSKHKFAATLDRVFKERGSILAVGTDPKATGTRSPRNGLYLSSQAKWTSTISNRWLAEGGFSDYLEHYRTVPLQGRYFERGTPAWYANARRTNNVLFDFPECELVSGCNVWRTDGSDSRTEGNRYVMSGSVSYVTGSHNIKTGLQYSWGRSHAYTDQQADLTQTYRNGAPNQVTISNSPRISYANVNYDAGFYVQDSWTIKRLTLNPGIRFESFSSSLGEVAMSAGRFVPARFYPVQTDLPPHWKNNPTPRFAVSYDLFGNGKTAIKGNISKYNEAWAGAFASPYSPVANSTSTFNWTDTNGDDIAQESEFLPAGGVTAGSNANFGVTRVTRAPDPNIKRAYNIEQTLQLQQEVMPRVAVGVQYVRRTWRDVGQTRNTLVSRENWLNSGGGLEFAVPNPLVPGQSLKAYQLSPAVRGQSFTLDYTSSAYRNYYDAFEVNWNARLKNGSTLFGAVTVDKNITVDCGEADDPNATGVDRYLGFTVARGLQAGPDGTLWCDQRSIGMPWRKELKFSGTLPLPFGFETAASFQILPGEQYQYTYALQNNNFPGGTNVGTPQTILLTQPGTLFYPNQTQLDINFKKLFRVNGKTFSGQVDLFNALNASTILSKTTTVSLTNTGAVNATLDDVTSFLQGRLVRVAFQMRF